MGYTDWKHTVLGGAHNSVPDSCCLSETPQCGKNVFMMSNIKILVGKIHTHGCLTIMLRRLETHVTVSSFQTKSGSCNEGRVLFRRSSLRPSASEARSWPSLRS